MTMELKRCECAEGTGPGGCQAAAMWLVAVGSRKSDAQLACGRHLNRTCWAMTEAEMPRAHVALTVTPVRIAELTP